MTDAEPNAPGIEVAPDVAASAAVAPATALSQGFPYTVDEVRRELNRVRRGRRVRIVLAVIAALIVALVVAAVLVLRLPSSLRTVSGDAMAPMVSDGQIVYVTQVASPKADEVIAYLDSSGEVRVGRVVAVSDEWVNAVSDGTVVVSDAPLSDATASGIVSAGASILGARQVPTGGYCVVGDAEDESERVMADAGAFIRGGQVIGRVDWRVWPLGSFGEVR